jgi:acyl dehydratase
MQFEEISEGQVIELGPVSVTEDEIIDFARKFDPQPFHIDPVAAKASRWGGVIASGWHTAAIAMRMVVDGVLAGSNSVGSPGIDQLRWLHPVRPGDALWLRMEVMQVRRSDTRANLGIVVWRWRLFNQEQREVASLVGTSMFQAVAQTQSGESAA